MSTAFVDVVDLLIQIEEDQTVPKNIRERVKAIILCLQEHSLDTGVKVSKALDELDAISDDSNLPTYTRTQVWHVASLLESHK